MSKNFVKIYENNNDIILVTNTSDYEQFLTELSHDESNLVNFLLDKDEKIRGKFLRRLIFEIVEISCKLKGYKAEKVMQNILYACGDSWPEQQDYLSTKNNKKERLVKIIYTILYSPSLCGNMVLNWDSSKDCDNYNYIYLLSTLIDEIKKYRYYKRNDQDELVMSFSVREEFSFFDFFKVNNFKIEHPDIGSGAYGMFLEEIASLTNSECHLEGDKISEEIEHCITMILHYPELAVLLDDEYLKIHPHISDMRDILKEVIKIIKDNNFTSEDLLAHLKGLHESNFYIFYSLSKVKLPLTKEQMEEEFIRITQELCGKDEPIKKNKLKTIK